ncbi:MAG: polysaccharide biosynthesis protein [Firmicutes bacterium]|nr:polysaccharide biosynthesis protein [Bacillota bacterium]
MALAKTKKKGETSFVKQAAILAAATLFVRFIGFLYRVPLTHLIGDEGNALYNAGFQFYAFLLVLSSAGLPAAIAKMVSERVARKEYKNAHLIFRSAMVVAVTFGSIGSILLWSMAGYFSVWFGYPGSVYAIRAVSPAVLLVAIMAVFRGYFQGMNNTVPTAVSQVVEQFFNAVAKIALAYIFLEQLEWAAAGATAGTGIGAFLGLLALLGIYKALSPRFVQRIRRDRSRKTEKSSDIIRELVATAFPIIIGTAIYSIANFIDMAMVSHRLNSTGLFTQSEIDVLYGQLTGKFVVLTTLPVAVSSALSIASLPSIAGSTAKRDRKAVSSKITKATRLSMLVAIPSAVGIGVLAEPILLLLFPSHPEGAILLQVGAVSVVFLSLVQVSTGALQGIGKIMFPVAGALAGAVAKIPLNFVLIAIPEINVLGAVISTIVCYFFAMLINWGALKKYTKIKIDWMALFIKPGFAAAMMGVTCFVSHYTIMLLISNNTVATIISILFGIFSYFLMLIILRGLAKEDVQRVPILKNIVK